MSRGIPRDPTAPADGWGYRDHSRRDEDRGGDVAPPAARAEPPAIVAAPTPRPGPDEVLIGQEDDWEPHFGTQFHRGPRRPAPGARRKAPATLNPEIARRYEAGESMPRIARELGTTVGTVAARLRSMGIPRRDRAAALRASGRGRRPAPIDEAELLRLRREGTPMAEIARRFGVAESTVRARLAGLRRAVPDAGDGREARDTRFRPGGPPPTPSPARRPRAGSNWPYRDEVPREWAEIARRYRQGESIPRISGEMGIPRQTVRCRLVAMGVPRRGRTEARRDACTRPDVSTGEIVRLVAMGVPKREVARRLKISPRTVRDRLAAAAAMPPSAEIPDVPPPPSPGPIAPAPAPAQWDGQSHWNAAEVDEAELVRLYVEEGLSLRDVGARLGMSGDLVRGRLRKLGVARRSPGRAAGRRDNG